MNAKTKALDSCDSKGLADECDCTDVATDKRVDNKKLATFATCFAHAGRCLIRGNAAEGSLAGLFPVRSNPAEGAVAFYAIRWDYLKALPAPDAAHAFLKQIGGAP